MQKFFLFVLTYICLIFSAHAQGPKPVIGISGVNAGSSSVRAMFSQVAASGGTPLFLSNFAQRDAKADINKIDGLIIMGNSYDIDPARYGAKTQHPETQNEMDTPEGQARAAYEFEIMRLAITQNVPLLGICGGHQRLNVLRGGTLHQHVPDLVGHEKHMQYKQGVAPFIPVMPVEISEGSQLAEIADGIDSLYVPGREADRALMTNSFHHQAIDRLGSGLRAVAFSDEYEVNGEKQRIIEAVEAEPKSKLAGKFILGVQWHPEFSASPLGPRLTQKLVERAAQKPRSTLTHAQIAAENRLSAIVSDKKTNQIQ